MKANWKNKPIGDVCQVIAGQSPEGKFYNAEGHGLPFFQGKKEFGEKYLGSPTTWTTQTTKIALSGDILMSVRAPVGPVNFATNEICIGRGLAAIRAGAEVNREFLFYYFLYLQPEISGKEGAVFASINKADIEAIRLSYPPLLEQQRMIAILDEAFDAIAKAKANAERNRVNAREVFESEMQAIFSQRGEGWINRPMKDLCKFENGDRGENYPSKAFRTSIGIPFINAGHLNDNGIDFSTMNYIPRERFELLGAGKIKPGDILFCLRGSLGKFASVGSLTEGAIASSLVIIRNGKEVLSDFLLAYLRSRLCEQMIDKFKNGAAQPNLSAQSLGEFVVPVPPIKEQQIIVEQLGTISTETKRLEAINEKKLARLLELRSSLLHQAFNGML